MGPLWAQGPGRGTQGLLCGGPAGSRAGSPCPLPRPARVPTHLQHELTLVPPHEDELSGEPVAGAAAAHQEPRGDAHLGAHEARPALGVGGVVREGILGLGPGPWAPQRPRRAWPMGLKHLDGAAAVAAFGNAGLQASPSRTVPVLHGPPPRLRSPLMLWAHVYPLLSLGARGQACGASATLPVRGPS